MRSLRQAASAHVDEILALTHHHPEFPSLEETLRHPGYPSTIWALQPHSKGKLAVAEDRGGPWDVVWEIHGKGPIKLCLLMGLAGVKTSWQRQTKYFGHDHGDEYSVLILDNRGMGESDKPLGRYTTSDMALDVVDVLNHVGWTEPREINLVGISLGGMIAQEVACAIPTRLQSLSLLCTSASIESDKPIMDKLRDLLGMISPKTDERAIAETARQIFPDRWLLAPDAELLPSPHETPACGPAVGTEDGEYVLFKCNFQRFQAQEMTKRRDTSSFTKKGFLCQLMAVGWHHKTPEQLTKMADTIGRERIMVLHGSEDKLIQPINGKKLMEEIKPGVGMIVDGAGHAPIMQMTKWFNELLEERLQVWAKLQENEDMKVVVEGTHI